MMRKLRVAIVGCGSIAQKRHIPSFLRLKRKISVCAVCDLNERLAREVAKKFGVSNAYSNLSGMLSEECLDVVDICTPPQAHASVAIEAMESGCNILMEKPMALNISDCDKMIYAARKSGVRLSIVHNQRFYPPFIKAQKLVDEGAIGKLTGIRVLSLTPRNEYMAHKDHWVHKLPGGVVGETGPHTIYMALAFMKNVKSVGVHAKKTLDYPWVLYDDYRIELEGGNINCSIYISHAGDYTKSEVDLFGIDGAMELKLESMLLTHYKLEYPKPKTLVFSSLASAGQIIKGVVANAFAVMLHKTFLGHDIMIGKFVHSIMEDQPVPVSMEEGRETVRVMEMIVDKLDEKYSHSAHSSSTGIKID